MNETLIDIFSADYYFHIAFKYSTLQTHIINYFIIQSIKYLEITKNFKFK